jgi:hypothetical protein
MAAEDLYDRLLYPAEDPLMPEIADAEPNTDKDDAPDESLAEFLEVIEEAHGNELLFTF